MKTDKIKIGFIGAGNMATALIKGLLDGNKYRTGQLTASDNDEERLNKISIRFGIKTCTSNIELVKESNIIILAVKPQVLRGVLEEIKSKIKDDHLLISIAAGIPIKLIQSIIGENIPVIRVMPNTPALIQMGVSALSSRDSIPPGHMSVARSIFESAGKAIIVEEKMMDAVTAISGSGPGFIFKIIESFVDGAKTLGFDEETSLLLVIQTFLGASNLAETTDLSLSQLREMVVSPGGTTAAGLAFFEEKGLVDIIKGGVEAAFKRSIELGKDY